MSEVYRPGSTLVGSHVGNYVVERMIGQGGMGEVYLARHPELGRSVAVKILTGNLAADETAIGRFRQEAMAACRIGHDAIVEILDIGQLGDGRHYYVMEHLQGQSLHDYLETAGPQPPETCLEVLRPVVAALAAAHAVGIVHRDIKPDNIFLAHSRDGRLKVKVLDFGIAKLVDTTVPPLVATRSGALIGTPLFMSPEQCAGKGDIGPATDVYAVGALLFNMLTGRPPFIGEGVGEVLVQHMQNPPPSVRSFRPELSDALDSVVQCALAKLPAERFQTAAALGAALETAVTGAAPQSDQGGATLRLSGSTSDAGLPDAAVPRALSQTSLSAAAAQRVPLPARQPGPASTGTPSPSANHMLMIAVVVGLAIGAGAVALGVFLGRSPKPAAQKQRHPHQAGASAIPPGDGGVPRSGPSPVQGGNAANTSPRQAPQPIALPAPARARPILLPPAARARSIPLAQARAASAPPGDMAGPAKLNRTQQQMAHRWLELAHRFQDKGNCNSAVTHARMAYKFIKSTAAIRIIGHCACRVGGSFHGRYARWAYGLLPRKDRAVMKTQCGRSGVILP